MPVLCSWDVNEHFPLAAQSPDLACPVPSGPPCPQTGLGRDSSTSQLRHPAFQSGESASARVVSLHCAMRLLVLEAAPRVEPTLLSLGRVSPLASAGAGGKALGS